MRYLVPLTFLIATTCFAQIQWAPAPEAYRLGSDGSVEISDGGQSTSDKYLLSAQDYRDFSFEFDLIARQAGGGNVRAIVVWAVQADKTDNRKAIFLPAGNVPTGRRAHFRLLVLGEACRLYQDGKLITTSAVVYGEPPAQGRVGLLHYYNHHFRYENLRLTALDTKTLMAPRKLQATFTKGDVVRLTWEVAADYADLLRYRVTRQGLTRETTGTELLDPTARSNTTYTYTVEAIAGDGIKSAPATVTIKTGKLLPPIGPERLTATRRTDDSVRLRWQSRGKSRCAGVSVYWADRINVKPPQLKKLADLPETASEYLAAPPVRKYYIVAFKSPDGGMGTMPAVEPAPMAPPVPGLSGLPSKHPYLLYSQAQMDRVRRALQTKEYEKLLTSLRGSAEAYLRQPAAVPTGVTDEMSAVTSRMQQMGLYYQALGDERCAQWVHDALVGYAKLYATLPDRGKRVKISKTVSGLYEAVWFVPLVCAYDLVYESPCFSAEDRRLIETDLLRPGADLFWVKDYNDPRDLRPGDLHYKCYNFQAWFDSAVGLCGLLLKDADMVEHAIDGPYGLKHLLAHDVHDDGLFWERSVGYHGFVISALFPFLEAGAHCNLDLYKMAVPDDYNTDREPIINYCAGDGDNGPKTMKLMFDAPFYYTFPDLTWPVVADSGRGPLSVNAAYRAAWEHYRDPKYAWLINRGREITIPRLGVKDAEAKVWLSWDDQRLYIAADITDQVVRNSWDQPNDVWQGDALWVGLKWRAGQGGPYDFIYGLSPGDFAKVPPVAALFNRYGAANQGASAGQYAVTKTPEGYALELAIPLSELAPQGEEKGTALLPKDGGRLTADFVLYDCDAKEGATTKEKMVCWSCATDRYDSAEGGTVFLGPAAIPGGNIKMIAAPRAEGLTMDGKLDDWAKLSAHPASIGAASAIMTDASSGGPNLDDLLYERPPDAGKFDYTGSKFCNNGVLAAGSSLFPSTGFALLRSGSQVGQEGTAVNLTYGPYGGGHGHPDKLSIVVWNDGKQIIPDFGSCGYDSVEKGQWTAHTISHNTLTVDDKSQYPGLDTDKTWPCDSFEKRAQGKLSFFHADQYVKVAQASCDNVFEGVKLTRTVALVEGQVLDFYRVQSNETHVYDYALHIDAPFQKASVPLTPLADPLGKNCGYQHIHKAQGSAVTSDAIKMMWGEGEKAWPLTVAGGEPTQLIVGESITTALDKTMPMLILRREAKDTIFASAIAPFYTGGRAPWGLRKVSNGIWAGSASAALVLADDPGKPCVFSTVSFVGMMVCTAAERRSSTISLMGCSRYEAEGFRLTADNPVSLQMVWGDDLRRIIMGRDSRGKVTIVQEGHKPLTLNLKPGQVVEFPE